jgi:uncharacterized protein (DUF433 family)
MDPERIVHSDPGIVSGTPVFVGTRVPAQALLDYLEGGETIDEFLDDFPSVSREQVIAFLEEAGRALLARIAWGAYYLMRICQESFGETFLGSQSGRFKRRDGRVMRMVNFSVALRDHFEVLLTADRRLQFQQNLSRFNIGVVVIVTVNLRYRLIRLAVESIREALAAVQPGEVLLVQISARSLWLLNIRKAVCAVD